MLNTTISHYRIVEHLGGGGMGVVYKAEDIKLGRMVALKFLPPEWSRDPDARERFLREARAASALEDSRICTIFDINETDDGRLFIAMAFYEGETLKKRLERGRLPIDDALDIAIQVVEGLESAHAAEILHRDIKPANLMLTGHDEVVIVDFGLAKLAGDFTLTKPGSSLGTPHYMSPEQSRGQPLDARTDLWSLGVVLYEMLTGERPFAGENHTSVARAILDDNAPDLGKLRPDASPELGRIVAKALEKNADRRYQNAGELLADLRTLRQGLSEFEGMTLSAPSQPPRRRRSPLVPVLISVALILGAAAVIWYVGPGGSYEPTEAPPPRIVVLPFENLGPPEDEYFADGMTEEITSRLSAVSGLHVISRTSAMYYKGRHIPLKQIGEELDVQYALEGTVRWERAGDGRGRVRITPQLIEVAVDRHLWSNRYDRAIESVFEVQSEIAGRVVSQLNVSLLEPEEEALNARPTDNLEAYEAYLRGLRNESLNDFEKALVAVKMFERAVELDPGFAEAWAALGRIHAYLYGNNFDPSPERRALAKQAVEKALDLDPSMPEVRLALGFFYYKCDRDYERALAEFAAVLAVQPNQIDALYMVALVDRRQGRWEESTRLLEQVFSASPRDFDAVHALSGNHKALRDFQQAEDYCDLAISLEPDNLDGYDCKFTLFFGQGRFRDARAHYENLPLSVPVAEVDLIYLQIAEREFEAALATVRRTPVGVFERAYGDTGAIRRAIIECECLFLVGDRLGVQDACGRASITLEELIHEHGGQRFTCGQLGLAYAYLGRREGAIREGQRAVELIAGDAVLGPLYVENLAHIYALVGEHDAAIDRIEYLLSIPSNLNVASLRTHPFWDPLRDHPRFQALLEEYEVEQ